MVDSGVLLKALLPPRPLIRQSLHEMEHICNTNEAHWVPKWVWSRVPILSGHESEALAGSHSYQLYKYDLGIPPALAKHGG